MTLTAMFAVNNRHGNLTDRITALEVSAAPGETLLYLECDEGAPYTEWRHGFRVRIGDEWFKLSSLPVKHVGNLIWDAARISGRECVRLLNHLRPNPAWTCTEGDTALFEAWNAGRDITTELLEQAARGEAETPTRQARRELVEFSTGGQH